MITKFYKISSEINYIDKDLGYKVVAIIKRNEELLLVSEGRLGKWDMPSAVPGDNESDVNCLSRRIFEMFPGLNLSFFTYKNFHGQRLYIAKLSERRINHMDDISYIWVGKSDFVYFTMSQETYEITEFLKDII